MSESTDLHAALIAQDPRLLLVNAAGVSHIETLETLAVAIRLMRGEVWRGYYRKARKHISSHLEAKGWSVKYTEVTYQGKSGRSQVAPTIEIYNPIRCTIWIDHKRPHAKGAEILDALAGDHCKVIVLSGCESYDMSKDNRQEGMFHPSKLLASVHALMCIGGYRGAVLQAVPPTLTRGNRSLNWMAHTDDVLAMVAAAWDYGEPLNWRAGVNMSHHFQAVMDKRFGWHPKVTRACYDILQRKGLVMKSLHKGSRITGLRVVPKIELDPPRVGEFQAPDPVVPALSGSGQPQAPYLSDSVLH